MRYNYSQHHCYDCFIIEGESELSMAIVPLILGYQSAYIPAWCTNNSNPLQAAIITLYTGAMMQDLAVEQHSTWNGSVLNHPIQRLSSGVSSHQPGSKQDN